MSVPDRRELLIREGGTLSLRRQCALSGLARSGIYRTSRAANDNDPALMRRIDELFLTWPFLGSRRMTAMRRAMGIAALGPKPRTTIPAPGHKIYPCLLRDLVIDRANQVWASDITYIPVGRGFLHLVAIIDWHSRAVLAWRLSNTMDTGFCLLALEDALARHGLPAALLPARCTRRASGSRWTAGAAG
ncbi:DDE-type integrase/transposase/recombinase, partial [Acidomonas methanolica]